MNKAMRIQTPYTTVIRRCRSHSTSVGNKAICNLNYTVAHFDTLGACIISVSFRFHDRALGLRLLAERVFTGLLSNALP